MVKGKNLNLALANLRRSRRQIGAIVLLLFLASVLLHIFLYLSTAYSQNFYAEKTRLQGEDIDILLMRIFEGEDLSEPLGERLSGIGSVAAFEVDRVVTAPGTVHFNEGLLNNNITLMPIDSAARKQIGKYEILETDGEEGVYVSCLFRYDGGYGIGDDLLVTLGTETFSFRIAGFYNNVDTGTANCTDMVFLLPAEEYARIAANRETSYRISLRLQEPDMADRLESDIVREVTEGLSDVTFLGSSTARKLATARYVTATIFEAVLCVSAVLMIAVILATVAITLSNYIRGNIRNLGTLKAIGYTSRDLISPLVREFSVLALGASLLGTAASYAVLPLLNRTLEKQVGIPFRIRFHWDLAVLTVAVCVGVTALTAWLSVLKIRRIAPIQAIRENRGKKSGRKNRFALDKTGLGLQTALSLKGLMADKLHAAVLFLSMTFIAFLLGFSACMYQNVILDRNAILDLVCGQRTDSVLSVTVGNEDTLVAELQNHPAVERYYLYSNYPITPAGMPKIYSYVVGKNYHAPENVCLQGRLPISEYEIAVNCAYAEENGLGLGDRVSVETGKENADFRVVGLTQGAYNSGRDCYLTERGYARIASPLYVSYYVDLREGTDPETFHAEIGEKCPLICGIDYQKFIGSVSASYVRILIVAAAVVVLLSYLIAAFILYILISVFLANRRREHGILKSLGFVSRDLVYQTVLRNLPPCLLGTVLGLALSANGAGKLLTTALHGIGIFSFGTATKFWFLLVSGAALMGFTLLVSVWMARSVRKITPHELFNRE